MSSTVLKNSTILVIDDDADICQLLRILLEEYGAAVIVAHSVDAALASCRRNPPHLIVSDILLGASDGYTLIETIREHRSFTPAVALTGFVAPSDEERARAAGFNAFIRKPFEPEDLIKTIDSLLRGTTEDAA